ncbi:Acetyltransferase (GNAT) domain-containing protein [Nitrosospira sp. Nl5]|uniref:GNAT family N-acetyltransferase n=1 Tax=Nitrosospira sp. Nl5 TaxID=200120 RepID=UPI00088832D5|nr:GNAT family N-acetyltransferase [Nitrosospira sp. Nl5]SCY17560.1 Acetyltransferase (GNAT) domain-containing protein [Nitrosospira sp. Nl5]
MKLQLGDKTLLATDIWLQVREVGFDDETPAVAEPVPPADSLQAGSQGFLIRSLRITSNQPVFSRRHGYLCYVPSQYPRYYIDMRMTWSEYRSKFSAKTRSTLNRKIRKYAEYCGGDTPWKVYKTAGEMTEFHQLARAVSKITYQERLLDAGMPDSEEFLHEMERLAQQGRVRGFILFHQNQPVSYLYCPVVNGILIYAFLGYDPRYMNFSVGTILQWLALEYLFEERSFRFFDFTEGQSEHKKLFATHNVQCANVFFLRSTSRNFFLVHSQRGIDRLSHLVGEKLDQLGMKAAVRRLMRFGK